mgnify:CR=1 FL=1
MFQAQRHRQVCRTSPNSLDRNQIEHVKMRRRFRRSLLNVRAEKGADKASIHHLVRCKIRLKLARRRKKQASRTIYNSAKLKDLLHKWIFSTALKTRFEAQANATQAGVKHGQSTKTIALRRLIHLYKGQGHGRNG